MQQAIKEGRPLLNVLQELKSDLENSEAVVAHNMRFDKNVLFNAYKWRLNQCPR